MLKYGPYSHSRISVGYCNRAFKKKYIDGEVGTPGPNSLFGKVVHAIFADIISAEAMEEEYVLSNIMDKHIEHGVLPRIREIQDILELFSHRMHLNMKNLVAVEEKVAVDEFGNEVEWDSEDAYFRGILDAVEINGDTAKVIDHKTQFNILSQEQMDNNAQLTGYCYLAKCRYPQLKNFDVEIYFARFGATRKSKRTERDLDKFRQEIGIAIDRIESIDSENPIAGPACMYCEFKHDCPLASLSDEIRIEIGDRSAAESIAEKLHITKQTVSDYERSLKAFCSENGPVNISHDHQYGHIPYESSYWDIEDVKEVCERHGIGDELLGIASVTATAVKKSIRRYRRSLPEFSDDLSSIEKYTTKTKFAVSKKKESENEQ